MTPASTDDRQTPREQEDPTEALRQIPQLLSELQEYAQHYFAARQALVGARIRAGVLKTGMGILALLAGGAAVVTSVSLLLIGLAQLLARATGGRAWLGNLLVGGGLLLVIMVIALIVLKSARRASIEHTVTEFEARKDAQRNRFAHSAFERSGAVPLRSPEGHKS